MRAVKSILKLLLTGLVTTLVRVIGQLVIPAGGQTVLPPSVCAQNGTMPLAFAVYGVFAYTLIAALFLRLRELGVDVDPTTFTVEQAVPQLRALLA